MVAAKLGRPEAQFNPSVYRRPSVAHGSKIGTMIAYIGADANIINMLTVLRHITLAPAPAGGAHGRGSRQRFVSE